MALTKTFRNSSNNDASGTTLTSASFNSSGATGIVVWCKHEGAPTTITISDSASNTYTAETKINHGNGDLSSVISSVLGSPATSSTHTVTMTVSAAKTFRYMLVWTLTGTTPAKDVAAQASGTSATPDAGSLVTTAATVSFLGGGIYNSVNGTASAGWTEDFDTGGSAHGYSRSDASGTLDPSYTITGSNDWVANSLSVKEGSAAAGQPYIKRVGGVPFSSVVPRIGSAVWREAMAAFNIWRMQHGLY